MPHMSIIFAIASAQTPMLKKTPPPTIATAHGSNRLPTLMVSWWYPIARISASMLGGAASPAIPRGLT
jgi:hypothetical protein